MEQELQLGDLVSFSLGVAEIRGTVAEIYGLPPRVQVVIALTPELSSYVVDEPSTVSLPIADVRRVVAASHAASQPTAVWLGQDANLRAR